jgi:hypothetical protein
MHGILLIYIVGRATCADCSSIMIYVSIWWILWYIWCLWWILWYIWWLRWILWNAYYAYDFWWFLYVQNKKMQRTLCRAFLGRLTTKWPELLAAIGPLPCIFGAGTRQRANLCRAFSGWRTTKPIFAVRFWEGTRQRPFHAVCNQRRELLFFCRAPPCGARQCDFAMQKSTVCSLLCAPMKNARQKLYRAPGAHGKPRLSCSDECVWNI